MPIEFKREGNTCEKCKKPESEVGKITHYTEHGDDLLLCPECLKFRKKPYTAICPKCKRLAYKHGGMSFYGEPPYDDEDMCLECVEKKEKSKAIKDARKLKTKNFAKDHWKFWIGTAITIIFGLIALFRIT